MKNFNILKFLRLFMIFFVMLIFLASTNRCLGTEIIIGPPIGGQNGELWIVLYSEDGVCCRVKVPTTYIVDEYTKMYYISQAIALTCNEDFYAVPKINSDPPILIIRSRNPESDNVRVIFTINHYGEFDKFVYENNSVSPTLSDSYTYWDDLWKIDPVFYLSGLAGGLSYDEINPGKIMIGTSTFTATVFTFAGQTPYQILNEAKNQLIAGGVQNVRLFPQFSNPSDYYLSFKVDSLDTLVTFGSDDNGMGSTFEMRTAVDTINYNRTIVGDSIVSPYSTNNIYTVSPPVTCGFWDIWPNRFGASIEWSNDSTASVTAGSDSCFTLYYNSCIKCGIVIDRIRICTDNPLPIELSSFTATIKNRDVTLNWRTSSEFNNYGYELERATVNNAYSEIGFVSGKGTVNTSSEYYFDDKNLTTGRYNYRLKQIDFNGNYKYYNLQNEVMIGLPDKFSLHQNFPNPFNPVTKIRYDIPVSGNVSVKIYDNIGREVKSIVNEFKDAGYYTVEFNGSNLPSGIYYYKLETGNFTATRKMVLIK